MSATVAIAGCGSGRSKFPFTTTQWQELEHQALIYKYMSAGIPIPPDLLFSIKTSLDSSFSNTFFPYQSTPLGWNPYQMGYGKKIDPEPGRCRRTDGKKWRCAKEAFPDSKYCERHMHRGKSRSRKPVESPLANNLNVSTSITSSNSAATTTNSLNAASNLSNNNNTSVFTNKNPSNTSMYSFSSSDSSYNNSSTNAHLLYSNGSSFAQKDYRDRYYQGLKDGVGEHAFLKDNSISSMGGGFPMDGNWPLVDKQSNGYPNYLQQSNNNNNNNNNRDFNCDLSMKIEEQRSSLSEKTTHHFFDEWPIKTNGGNDDSLSTTQLSISIPSSTSNHHNFFLSNSRNN